MSDTLKKIIAIVILAPLFWLGWVYINKDKYRAPETKDNQIQQETSQETSDEQIYRDEQYSFEIRHSKDYELKITGLDNSDFRSDTGETNLAMLTLREPKNKYPNTDLKSSYLAVSTTEQSLAECGLPMDYEVMNPSSESINGVEFAKRSFGDAAAGTQHFGMKYAAYRNQKCFVLSEVVITSGFGAIDGIEHVDFNQVLDELHDILST